MKNYSEPIIKDIQRDIAFFSLGNGYSVCDRSRNESGDYMRIAHINYDRSIDWYKPVNNSDKKRIEHKAKTDTSNVSVTQDWMKTLNPLNE